ncbi:DUF424 family protein [Candidatus Woesearchaeota archaeon]|jgi:hypothetical protein|nr:DUF424 family protein [Candidatus Woesearchaeota archaeon]
MIVNTKKTPEGLILIVTDSNIINQKFEEGKKQLDLTSKFYQGEEKSKEEIKELINDAHILHLTGKEAVAFGKELNLVENIITIKDIPHAEVLL